MKGNLQFDWNLISKQLSEVQAAFPELLSFLIGRDNAYHQALLGALSSEIPTLDSIPQIVIPFQELIPEVLQEPGHPEGCEHELRASLEQIDESDYGEDLKSLMRDIAFRKYKVCLSGIIIGRRSLQDLSDL